jgi:hypothetical protein
VTDATATEPVSLEGEAYYQDPWGFFARLESRPVAEVRMPGYGLAWVRVAQLRPRTTPIAVGLADELAAADGVTDLWGCRSRPRRRNSAGIPSA